MASYTVEFVDALLSCDNPTLRRHVGGHGQEPLLLFIDDAVDAHFGADFRTYFAECRIPLAMERLVAGEGSKNLRTVEAVLAALAKHNVPRRGRPVLAVGGGVVTDVVCFATSIYRRGVSCLRLPTTLMGMIDAAVGIKNGVNFLGGKNRVGVFQPSNTLIDSAFLSTLSARHISNGFAELVKLAIVTDSKHFALLESDGRAAVASGFQNGRAAQRLLELGVAGMLSELERNLWEHDYQRPVDFGHWLSPRLEMHPDIDLLHGEAVAIDCCVSCAVALRRGYVEPEQFARVLRLMRAVRLPVAHAKLTAWLVDQALADTVAHRGGSQNIPLPRPFGKVEFVQDLSVPEVMEAAQLCLN